ncbi:30S ribosomal protein S3 [Thiosulfatimonas sediminis]|uniref:Small ribosomal subunit protein uS3 n=1 Tax=Thiosulfatimonas sediminis TaxID=2675054 RepID=A0A6F8PXK1_9GAMM|nr:30S ribosomal protein S3 [Thiosulfatimonas sediminis]BBP46849.1 30S ribosomal protein S3 [Thiosulfatimonas sediminis]
MGQKVNPVGIRLGITRDWNARWYADSKNYSDFLVSDVEIRKELNEKLGHASVSAINIERVANGVRVTIHTARPGVVIGKKGEDIEKLKQSLSKKTGMPVNINIEEIKKPELDAKLVGQSIAQQLEKRIQFRRAMKRAVGNAMRLGAEGIKVTVSGRLNGADIARAEWYREGRVPLHTFRADIDYATYEADTTYGKIGVKVWIFKGEKLGKLALDSNDSKGKKGRK